MTDTTETGTDTSAVDRAVAEGGAYEVLARRLAEQGQRLRALADGLNSRRLAEFGSSAMEVVARVRVRTEHNCVARDIVQVGELMVFGYNVFLGLKKETQVGDVFSLYRLVPGDDDGYEVAAVELAGTFLDAPGFVNDFRELYAYYKDTRLQRLAVRDGKLLAAFQIGERITDLRVFRWSVSVDGREVRYIDNRGERDIALPAPFDFEWTPTTREMAVNGRHPHINILDSVFVETIGGDLTIKVEDNTEDGLGVYREPVEDKTQSLDDAEIEFARVGSLILLRVLPYRETQWRHLVFNTLTRKVERIDAIGQSCIQLPEDHGIVFPGGYYLQNGESKRFEQSMDGMRFKRAIRSPNGEDVLYIFFEPQSGRTALFTYNLIERALQTPIFGHGYARLDDGRMVVFSAESDEPTRVHPMQVWRTPFHSDEYAAAQPAGTGFMARIGNAELVRGISDLYSLARGIEATDVSLQRYEVLAQASKRLFDLHHWLADRECGDTGAVVRDIAATSEAVLDEYEKVEDIRRQSSRAMAQAQTRQQELLASLRPEDWREAQEFVDALSALNRQRGHLLSIRELRYIDTAAIDAMEADIIAGHERVGAATSTFLASDTALQPFHARLETLDREAQAAATTSQLAAPLQAMAAMAGDLDMLSELMASLRVEDATERTRVVDALSALYARLNQTKARAEQRRRSMGSSEAVAQFGAQFTLFGQSVAGALASATDPERCDEQLSRLLVQLEELESQFGEHDQFLADILAKREELLDTFDAHKQALLDDRQRKAVAVFDAARRIIDGLPRRTARLKDGDELNAFFAGDALILKLRELAVRLRELKDNVRADDVEARLKGARDQAVRALRDRSELFEGGGDVIRLGPRHRFSVNTQELDLTLLPRGDHLALHLTGTDYFEPIEDAALDALRDYWSVGLASESPTLYRGEYLAGEVLAAARAEREGLSLDGLRRNLSQPEELLRLVRDFAAARYRDGYEKGIHDHDASLILKAVLPLYDQAGVLVHEPAARALACMAWPLLQADDNAAQWPRRARNARHIARLLGQRQALEELQAEIATGLQRFSDTHALPLGAADPGRAASYLVAELSADHPEFQFTAAARQLLDALHARLDQAHVRDDYEQALKDAGQRPGEAVALVRHWLLALCADATHAVLAPNIDEAVALQLWPASLAHRISQVDLRVDVTGLLGDHARIHDGAMALAVDDFDARLHAHRTRFLPGWERFQQLRHDIVARERERLRLDEFKPRPLSSFVRNRLINDVYLGIIGDNLAKQMGTVGENKRSDLMGLLMLISPPGYGKTTLMEYVAHRLGLVFMKINGPALGHEVHSLDPAQAPDATSAQELEKLNLALEMGSNVMLYVDDIQHTHPEFLQKFISLCDGTRRIEGVWKGRSKTYDLRGRKFCVVMAGNPYTESGEVFRIPDMLANRADIYNLGDVLGGMEDAFKLSYIENSLTSNAVLAPLATRPMDDVYRFVDKVEGRAFSANSLSHAYSGAEINEISAVLERMLAVREIVYRVNQQYIASAAQADRYRTEPPFKLQGSYRNMNKLAEKIAPVMNAAELDQLIADHYRGEAQLRPPAPRKTCSSSPNCAARWTRSRPHAGRRSSAISCATRRWAATMPKSATASSRSWSTSSKACAGSTAASGMPPPATYRGRTSSRSWNGCSANAARCPCRRRRRPHRPVPTRACWPACGWRWRRRWRRSPKRCATTTTTSWNCN
ncbi:DNA repair ATPase [Pseudofulvimonas gallinarii]|uniref:DNA repair ATPase n=1 Tax=Pseudofulvimonas gallinarii TaxID=634155 RepID=UPI001F0B9911|nr:DNA repair ATPase [Pseudofulvimonas gallinarii]